MFVVVPLQILCQLFNRTDWLSWVNYIIFSVGDISNQSNWKDEIFFESKAGLRYVIKSLYFCIILLLKFPAILHFDYYGLSSNSITFSFYRTFPDHRTRSILKYITRTVIDTFQGRKQIYES